MIYLKQLQLIYLIFRQFIKDYQSLKFVQFLINNYFILFYLLVFK